MNSGIDICRMKCLIMVRHYLFLNLFFMRNENVITQLRKRIDADPTPIIDLIKKHGPWKAAKLLRCWTSWLSRHVPFDYMWYIRTINPPKIIVLKNPDHKWVGNLNWLKTFSDDTGRGCTKCWTYKPWSSFRKSSQWHRWHSPMCNLCTSKYNKIRKEKRYLSY